MFFFRRFASYSIGAGFLCALPLDSLGVMDPCNTTPVALGCGDALGRLSVRFFSPECSAREDLSFPSLNYALSYPLITISMDRFQLAYVVVPLNSSLVAQLQPTLFLPLAEIGGQLLTSDVLDGPSDGLFSQKFAFFSSLVVLHGPLKSFPLLAAPAQRL